jgi:hypothetical protein
MTSSETTRPQTEEEARGQGYTRNFVADEPRLSEMVETYEELGFDVVVVPISIDDDAECTECMKQHPERFQVIYTKPGRD